MSVRHQMRWVSVLSQRLQAEDALVEALATLEEQLGSVPTLVLLFATHHHTSAIRHLGQMLRDRYPMTRVLGGTGQGVIGAQREVESREALSLTAAVLPDVTVRPVRWTPEGAPHSGWSQSLEDLRADDSLLLLGDPYTCDVDKALAVLEERAPGALRLGGLASGGNGPGQEALLLDDRVYQDGLVGLALSGKVQVRSIVAQGARAIGEPMIATRVGEGIVYELNAGRPTEVLKRLYRTLSPRDQQLCHSSLLLGVERPSVWRGTQGPGDFLLGDVVGMDPRGGAMAIDREVDPFQVVRFYLRDADQAGRELCDKLRSLPEPQRLGVRGGVMFNSVGRGERMYGAPDGDCRLVQQHLGPVPLGGVFCRAEIGPAGAGGEVHKYSSVMALFSDGEASAA